MIKLLHKLQEITCTKYTMSKNSIELNGNVYDVRTGKLISSTRTGQAFSKPSNQQPSMDVRRPKKTDRSSSGINHKKPLKKSQALMRSGVSKPTIESTKDKKQPISTDKKLVNFPRIERAAKAVKSSAVQKFHPEIFSSANAQGSNEKPVKTVSANTAKQQPPASFSQANQPSSLPVKKSFTQSALDKANSHEQTFAENNNLFSRLLDRLTHVSSTVKYSAMAILAIVGLSFAGYLMSPRISVQLAANRSGVAVSMPSYKPAGFQLNRTVEYEAGAMTLHYNSLTDTRNFRIKKASTDWNSEALRNNFVENKDLYQTVSSKGKTIYIYNGSNATWVDGGVWYTLEGASALNSDQLLRIADSM